jgi:hypothetical protein
MMKDAIGNVLRTGQKLWWISKGCFVDIEDLHDGGIVNPVTKTVSMPKIKLSIELGVQVTTAQPVPQLADFLLIQNPNEQRTVETILDMVDGNNRKPS